MKKKISRKFRTEGYKPMNKKPYGKKNKELQKMKQEKETSNHEIETSRKPIKY